MRIICKYPTRARPAQFLSTLAGWITQAHDLQNIKFFVNYDEDDATMSPTVIKDAVAYASSKGANLLMEHGVNASKIAAFNNHMDKVDDWDVCLLISDDFFCRRQGWDQVIRDKMTEHFPDTDGCLWFHDQTKQRVVCTQSCIGRRYFDRTGYVYNHLYGSFFCDNEETDKAMALGKIVFIEQGIASHEHPSWGGSMKRDALYQRNNAWWGKDQNTYERRKALGFPA